jgi:hypothetical protein
VTQQVGDWPRTVFCDLLDSSHYLQPAWDVQDRTLDTEVEGLSEAVPLPQAAAEDGSLVAVVVVVVVVAAAAAVVVVAAVAFVVVVVVAAVNAPSPCPAVFHQRLFELACSPLHWRPVLPATDVVDVAGAAVSPSVPEAPSCTVPWPEPFPSPHRHHSLLQWNSHVAHVLVHLPHWHLAQGKVPHFDHRK